MPPENAAAFGDGENDIEMFQNVGYGFAVDNAKSKLKSVANFLVPSNADLGVSKALEVMINAKQL